MLVAHRGWLWMGVALAWLSASRMFAAEPLVWPQFRGPTGQGTSTDKGVPTTWSETENIVWKTPLPGAGTSSPVVVGRKIFLTCYRGYNVPGESAGEEKSLERLLVCFDRATGKQLWEKVVPSKLPEQDKIRDDHGYASNTPVATADRLFVFFGKSGVFAFDHDGKQLWQSDVGSELNGWGSAASPILYKNLVIVNASVESETLVALDQKTGQEVWRAKGIREAWNTPILVKLPGGKTELVIAISQKVLGFDPDTGEQLWKCDTDINWYMVPCLVSEGETIYGVGGRSGGALAVKAGGRGDVTSSHRLWTGKKGSNVTSPILYNGHLYWMHENLGIAYCAEAKTGKIIYEERLDRADQVYGSPVLADGKLYYTTRSGRTFVIAAKPEFEKLATNDLERRGTFNASPAVADGKLLVRSNKFLYCLGTK